MTSSAPCVNTELEVLITEGCHYLSHAKLNGLNINITQTACDLGISEHYSTLHNYFLNSHKTRQEAHIQQQFLSPA